MRSSLAVVAALLASTALLSGCIQGAFYPAEIPQLAPGWSKDGADSQSGEKGLQPLVVAKYQVNVYQETTAYPGRIYVISVSNVPLVDLQAEISKQLEAKLQENNVQRTEKGRGTGTIGTDAATFIDYDATATISGVQIQGKAVDASYTCKANGEAVRVFGLATTDAPALLGGGHDEKYWRDIVGSNFPASLGGMVAAVKCA